MLCSFPHFLLGIGNSYFMLIRQFTDLLLKGDYDGVEWSKALGWEMTKGKSWLKKLKDNDNCYNTDNHLKWILQKKKSTES